MPIVNKELWEDYEGKNKDPYGNCCVDVAREVMRLLDEDPTPLHVGYFPDVHTPHGIICQADDNIKAGGITGFMASCVTRMVIACHSRGEEFRLAHNDNYGVKEEEAKGRVVNPSVITIKSDKNE